jgi:predicted ester cyclase
MSAKDPRALWRHLVEQWNKGKVAAMAVLDETNAPDIVFHTANGRDLRGINEVKQMFSGIYDALPDNHMTIDDIVVEGDKAAVRYTTTGTHKGALMGIPPTNKKVTMSVIGIDRVVNGKFVEIWERSDTLGMMQQLGAIPTPKK